MLGKGKVKVRCRRQGRVSTMTPVSASALWQLQVLSKTALRGKILATFVNSGQVMKCLYTNKLCHHRRSFRRSMFDRAGLTGRSGERYTDSEWVGGEAVAGRQPGFFDLCCTVRVLRRQRLQSFLLRFITLFGSLVRVKRWVQTGSGFQIWTRSESKLSG